MIRFLSCFNTNDLAVTTRKCFHYKLKYKMSHAWITYPVVSKQWDHSHILGIFPNKYLVKVCLIKSCQNAICLYCRLALSNFCSAHFGLLENIFYRNLLLWNNIFFGITTRQNWHPLALFENYTKMKHM